MGNGGQQGGNQDVLLRWGYDAVPERGSPVHHERGCHEREHQLHPEVRPDLQEVGSQHREVLMF